MIRTFGPHRPRIHPTAFVHDSAEVIGKVSLAARSSVWPLCVLRGDEEPIVIGPESNLQDLSVIHTRAGHPTVLGRRVTVGHRVVLHGCRIADGALIGMGAVVMEARIGKECLIGAGAVVPPGAVIAARRLVVGVPARVVRPLTPKELREVRAGMREYLHLSKIHRADSKPVFPR
ncbi:MAG: gamma carbonic anhydrase family protein [Elusimicrobia bacterium]|nr:gamma carbonic anhydrase family protein [Elusimicrobiota bacterium]